MPSPFGAPQAGDIVSPKKVGVRASYISNVANLAAATTSCDGVTLVEGDVVLLTEQSSSEQNGLYVVGVVASALAPLTRHNRFASAAGMQPGIEVFVSAGSTRGNKTYHLTTDAPVVVGTTSLTFTALPTLAAVTSLETRLSGAESVGELSSASVYLSLTGRVSTADSTGVSLDTRVSAETSKTTSLTARVSTEESTRGSGDVSLTTRVSTEASDRTSAAASLVVVDSAVLSTAASAAASIVVVASAVLSTATSGLLSVTTRLSSEESKLSSHIVAGH